MGRSVFVELFVVRFPDISIGSLESEETKKMMARGGSKFFATGLFSPTTVIRYL